MPIAIAEDEKQNKICELVSEILDLNKLRYKFLQIWLKISNKYKNSTYTFEKLIIDNRVKIQKGEFEEVWITEINGYPADNDEINIKFQQILLSSKNDYQIQIYGLRDKEEILLLDLTTSLKEFRDMLYISVLELINSRKVVQTLGDILSKTEIPVIQPNIEQNTPNLYRYTKAKLKEWKDKNKIVRTEDNFISIQNAIQELEIEVDKLVFDIYKMSKDEVEIILDTLEIQRQEKIKILANFI